MAKKRKNRDEIIAQQSARALSAHMWSLECFTVDDYLTWCSSRGFNADTNKTLLNMRQELAYHEKESAADSLRHSKLSKKPMAVIKGVCSKKIESEDVKSVPLHAVCGRISSASLAKRELLSLQQLLSKIWHVSKLPLQYENRDGRPVYYVDALISMHSHRHRWIRSIDEWAPNSHNREKQFLSLVQHLFLKYKVPKFFSSVWFRRDASAKRYQKWCIDIGNGHNPRLGPAPIPLTKKAAHFFLSAPDGYSIEQAIRFGQIRAAGGNNRLCNAVIGTRLGADFSNDEFWQSVIRFFIRNPSLELSQVGPIVDFLQYHKYERQQVFLENGETRWMPPPQPHLSMKKRTLVALLTQVNQWHRRLGKIKENLGVRWASSGIRAANFVRGKDARKTIWRINELLSHKELVREGNSLKHCVATYSRYCRDGHSSIWSMTSEDSAGNLRRRQTIEVNRYRRIVQCRGRMNKLPTDQERQIVEMWAKAESLQLGPHGF